MKVDGSLGMRPVKRAAVLVSEQTTGNEVRRRFGLMCGGAIVI